MRVRQAIFKGLKPTFSATVGRWSAGNPARRVVLLCYHSIDPSLPFSTPPALFESHLSWLSEHCDIVPFEECLGALRSATRPKVAITFDDGYRDNHSLALPLLLKHKMAATFFITTGLIEGCPEVRNRMEIEWQLQEGSLKAMDWSQVMELAASGMTIGAHTHLHPKLSSLTKTQLWDELSQSKTLLESKLCKLVENMSYPYGRPGSAVVVNTLRATALAGYRYASVVLSRGVRVEDDPLALPRFIVDSDSLPILRQKVLGWWDWIGRSRDLLTGL